MGVSTCWIYCEAKEAHFRTSGLHMSIQSSGRDLSDIFSWSCIFVKFTKMRPLPLSTACAIISDVEMATGMSFSNLAKRKLTWDPSYCPCSRFTHLQNEDSSTTLQEYYLVSGTLSYDLQSLPSIIRLLLISSEQILPSLMGRLTQHDHLKVRIGGCIVYVRVS